MLKGIASSKVTRKNDIYYSWETGRAGLISTGISVDTWLFMSFIFVGWRGGENSLWNNNKKRKRSHVCWLLLPLKEGSRRGEEWLNIKRTVDINNTRSGWRHMLFTPHLNRWWGDDPGSQKRRKARMNKSHQVQHVRHTTDKHSGAARRKRSPLFFFVLFFFFVSWAAAERRRIYYFSVCVCPLARPRDSIEEVKKKKEKKTLPL